MKTFLSLSSTLLGWIVWINHGKKYEFLCSNFCPCRRYFDLYCETFACERDNEKLIFSDSMKIVQFFPPMFGFCACSCEKVTTTRRAEMFFRSFTGCDCVCWASVITTTEIDDTYFHIQLQPIIQSFFCVGRLSDSTILPEIYLI